MIKIIHFWWWYHRREPWRICILCGLLWRTHVQTQQPDGSWKDVLKPKPVIPFDYAEAELAMYVQFNKEISEELDEPDSLTGRLYRGEPELQDIKREEL